MDIFSDENLRFGVPMPLKNTKIAWTYFVTFFHDVAISFAIFSLDNVFSISIGSKPGSNDN